MSRQIPTTVRRKEVIYRKTYLHPNVEKFDQEKKPIVVIKKKDVEQPQGFIVYSTGNDKINKKLNDIIGYLRNSNEKKPEDNLDQVNIKFFNEFPKKIDELSERLGNIEKAIYSENKTEKIETKINYLNDKLVKVTEEQKRIDNSVDEINITQDAIDNLLQVVNDTRMDLEEKINNIKRLTDANWMMLEKKLDDVKSEQRVGQGQLKELMAMLSSLSSSSRASSIVERINSRPSSKLSISEKSISQRTAQQTNDPDSEIIILESDRSVTPTYTKEEPSEQIETLNVYPDIQFIPITDKVDRLSVLSLDSSESLIAPLKIDGRRSSQPANVFHTVNQRN